MSQFRPGLLACPRITALFALVIAGIVWTQPARAGCAAHYVKVRLKSVENLARLDLLGPDGVVAAIPERAPSDRPQPCSGAFCSGNPAVPVPALPSISSLTRSELALPASVLPAADGGSLLRLPADEPLPPALIPGSVFHPPR